MAHFLAAVDTISDGLTANLFASALSIGNKGLVQHPLGLTKMQANSPVGSVSRGGHPVWAFDLSADPFFWIGKAEELNRMVQLGFSAWREDIERIRECSASKGGVPYVHRPCTLTITFFLAATAIENLLKANLIRVRGECVRDGKFHGPHISRHNLLAIAAEASITLDPDEADFCELGTESITWFGRYHTGKNISVSPAQITVRDKAFPIYEKLYKRLLSRLRPEAAPESGERGHHLIALS